MVGLSTIYVTLLLTLQVECGDPAVAFNELPEFTRNFYVDRSDCGSELFGISETGAMLYYSGTPLTEPHCNITIRKRIVFPSILLCVGVYNYENVYEMETFYKYNSFFNRKINGYKSTNNTKTVAKRINDYVDKTDKIARDRDFPIYYDCKDGPTEVVISFKENTDKMYYRDISAKYQRRRVKIIIFVTEIDAVHYYKTSKPKLWDNYDTVMSTDVTRDWRNADDTCVPDVLLMVLLLGIALVPQ